MSKHHKIESLEKIIEEQKIAISQISHEIRNPVTLINSSLKLIEKQHPEVHDFLFWDDTMRDMEYLLRLLNEVSNYNNSEHLYLESIDTSRWLTEISSSFLLMKSNLTRSGSFRFSCDIPPDLPVLRADSVKLRQAISNLIRNGLESLQEEGEISLSARADEQRLTIRISDTGCGISDEYIDTLFQPFVTHKTAGTGLGLPITKRIVEAHRGTLHMETSEGSGTSFSMSLPL